MRFPPPEIRLYSNPPNITQKSLTNLRGVGTKRHDPQSLRKLYMNYIHAMLEYLHLKLICIPSFEHDIQCTTFATNHIREGEIPNLLSFWVPQKEYEKF